ncbi:unnamed protein product [Cochlearia groenlandica]
MATRAIEFDPDLLLPPRKRLLAGYKKQNSTNLFNDGSSPISPLPCFASSSSSSSSSSSAAAASPDLDDLLSSSQINDKDQIRSHDELRANADLAVKIAKAARATANERAVIASKAVDAAKIALEFLDSFTVKEKSPSEKKKKKKHVSVSDEDLSRRLDRVINNSTIVLSNGSSHENKKQKIVASTMYNGHDGVADSDISNDDKSRVNSAMEEKKRGRVKLIKKISLSMCVSKDEEESEIIGVSSSNPPDQKEGSNGCLEQVRS